MASIKYDEQGFPVGELLKSGKDLAAELEQQSALLRNIRTDVRNIARAVGVQVSQSRRSSSTAAAAATSQREASRRKAATPAGRAGSARTAALFAATPGGRERAVRDARTARTATTATPTGRDAKGRFTAGSNRKPDAPDANRTPMLGATLSRLSDGIGRLSATVSGAENVDANLAAASEVKQVLSPIGRGFSFLFGRNSERKKERWFTRLWKAVNAPLWAKKGSGAPGGAAAAGDSAFSLGGVLGMLSRFFPAAAIGSMIAAVPGLLAGLFMRVLGPIAAVWGAFHVGKFVGGKIYEWLESSGLLTKAFDAFDSLKETVASTWNTAVAGFDRLVGEMKGKWDSAVAAITAIPEKLGTWVTGLDAAMRNLPVIGEAYAKAVDGLKSTVENARRGVEEGRRGDTTAPAKTVAQAIGRDVGQAAQKASEVGSAVGNTLRGTALSRWIGGAKDDLVGAAGRAGVDAGLLAQIAHFESKFDPAAKAGSSSAHGYGQFLDSTWTDMLNRHGAKYGVAGAGSLTSDQAAALRSDPKLQAAMLAEFTKENIVKGRKFGGSNDAANVYAFHNLGDGDAKRLLAGIGSGASVRDALLAGGQDPKRIEAVIKNNSGLYGDGNISAAEAYRRMGMQMAAGNRFALEARQAAAARNVTPVVTAGAMPRPQAANVPSPVPAQIPPAPEYKEPPHQLNSRAEPKVIVVPVAAEPGQNVSDRALAHVVTGGLGAP